MFCPNCSIEMNLIEGRDPKNGPFIFTHICHDCDTLGGVDAFVSTFPISKGSRVVFHVPELK